MIQGKWDVADSYISAFIGGLQDDNSVRIFFQIRRQKFIEAVMKGEGSQALRILCEELTVLKCSNDSICNDTVNLLSSMVLRKEDLIHKYGDRLSTRDEVMDLIKENLVLRDRLIDKIKFQGIDLRTLLKESIDRDATILMRLECQPSILPPSLMLGSGGQQGDGSHGSSPIVKHIDKLEVYQDVLGSGVSSTVMLGNYDDRSVAVKAVLSPKSKLKEVEIFSALKSHKNIVAYFGKVKEGNMHYLIFERHSCSLKDLIKSDKYADVARVLCEGDRQSNYLRNIMSGIACGLAYLHKNGIAHRNLIPENVLIQIEGQKPVCAKICGMGKSKWCRREGKSPTERVTVVGPEPEQLEHEQQTEAIYEAIDLWSFGNILYYCLTQGSVRDDDKSVKEWLLTEEMKLSEEALHLIDGLVKEKESWKERMSVHLVMIHPLFWDADKRIKFLVDAYSKIQGLMSSVVYTRMNANKGIFGKSWDSEIHRTLITETDETKKTYDYTSVCDLLKLVKSRSDHRDELHSEVLQSMRFNYPNGFEEYFSRRFPKLLMHVYLIIYEFFKDDLDFKEKYFTSNI